MSDKMQRHLLPPTVTEGGNIKCVYDNILKLVIFKND